VAVEAPPSGAREQQWRACCLLHLPPHTLSPIDERQPWVPPPARTTTTSLASHPSFSRSRRGSCSATRMRRHGQFRSYPYPALRGRSREGRTEEDKLDGLGVREESRTKVWDSDVVVEIKDATCGQLG
jgi:hypothetical protein